MKRNRDTLVIIVLLLIALLFPFNILFSAISDISGRGLTHEIRNDVWLDYPIEIQAAHFGSLTSNEAYKIYSEEKPIISTGVVGTTSRNNQGRYWWIYQDFCGNNDGELTIKNEYDIGYTLRMTSSMRTADGCQDANYMTAKVTLPKGILTANCNMKVGDRYGTDAWAECNINGVAKVVHTQNKIADKVYRGDSDEDFTLVLEEETEVLIYLKTHSTYREAFSDAELKITFEEFKECESSQEKYENSTRYLCLNGIWENQGDVECVSDSDCQNDETFDFCDDNKIMQTTKQYSCSNYECISFNKTEVTETCPFMCEMTESKTFFTMFAAASQSTPTCIGCKDNQIVLIDDIYNICKNNTFEVLNLEEFSDEEKQDLLNQIDTLKEMIEEQESLTLKVIWENYKIAIIIGALLFLIIIGGGRRK